MSGPELEEGIRGAMMVICNDYELELIRQKTTLGEQEILREAEILVVTRGEHGCTILTSAERFEVPAVAPHQIVDPTGVGDAFRAGFVKGLALEADLETCGRLGSVAATYALEHLGGTNHAFSWDEFVGRYEESFGRWKD
jgi:adenosine kinase